MGKLSVQAARAYGLWPESIMAVLLLKYRSGWGCITSSLLYTVCLLRPRFIAL